MGLEGEVGFCAEMEFDEVLDEGDGGEKAVVGMGEFWEERLEGGGVVMGLVGEEEGFGRRVGEFAETGEVGVEVSDGGWGVVHG